MLRAGFGGDGGFGLRLVWGRKKEGPGWRERLGAGERARVLVDKGWWKERVWLVPEDPGRFGPRQDVATRR